jgi:superfamily II DNA helicase RecQ
MRIKLMTFRYSATLGGFDDTPLVDFTRDKEVVAFREHFYAVNEVPHLTCIVHYQDALVPREALDAAREIAPRPAAPPRFQRRDGAPDPCEGLNEGERALFNHLREWRARQAHDDGVPPYLILTNRQLVAIVRKRPDSPTALGHLDGIGPGKVERYGAAILTRLHGASATVGPASASEVPA